MLVHSQLNRTVNAGSVSNCNMPRCSHCSSTTTSANFNVRENFMCVSSNFIDMTVKPRKNGGDSVKNESTGRVVYRFNTIPDIIFISVKHSLLFIK